MEYEKSQQEEEDHEHDLGYQAILLCLILAFYIVASHIIERKKIAFLHESALSILFGLGLAFILNKTFNVDVVQFNPKLFFNVILPPIIFSAGYNLRKKYFIENFGLIQFYGIIGTLIAFFVISTFSFLFNEWELLGVKLDFADILLLSSVLCATDTVAVLNLVKEQDYPQLNSILFGEGIMNDAISIVIFRSIKNFAKGASQEFETSAIFYILGDFLYLLVMSVLIGLVFGLAISYFFKKFDSYNQFPIRETGLIYLVSYITYLLAELCGFSGIISLFVCGIIMGQYTYQNISQTSQKGTVLVFETLAYLAEAFVFCYLGMSLYAMDSSQIPYLFSFLMIGAVLLARFFAVFTLPCIKFLIRKSQKLLMKELQIIWYSGLIRGAIAFAMALQIKSENSKLMVNTVMVVIVFTIVLLSSMLQVFSKYVGLQGNEEEEIIKKICINESKASDMSNFGSIGKYQGLDSLNDEKKLGSQLKQKLNNIEEKYVRPVFVKDNNPKIQEINLSDLNSL